MDVVQTTSGSVKEVDTIPKRIMSAFLALCVSLFAAQVTYSDEDNDLDFDVDDVCLSQFHIEKYTLATSDSYRLV